MATAVASGFGSVANTARWEVDIAQPHNIEVPRSLVDVVVSWNIPMHKWLKKCKYFHQHSGPENLKKSNPKNQIFY